VTAILGYARVSTTGQDLDAQLAALRDAGVDPNQVFTDKLSGLAKAARPGLAAMLDYVRVGDTVVVTAIDRLGRSVSEVTRTIADLGERRITLRTLREGWTPPRRLPAAKHSSAMHVSTQSSSASAISIRSHVSTARSGGGSTWPMPLMPV
jgi:DNA invertase Pin-like site-specific DNA recombinase